GNRAGAVAEEAVGPRRVSLDRIGQRGDQQGRLDGSDVPGGALEIGLRGRFGAEYAGTPLHHVEVDFHGPALPPDEVGIEGDRNLERLPEVGERLAPQEQVLDGLHGYRAGAAVGAA